MASYLVLTPPGGPETDHARTRFVRDGFSLIAFLFPGLWLLAKRLWFGGALALILQALAITIARQPGLFLAGLALAVAVSMLVALEGPSLVTGDLERKDWTLDAIVVADDIDTAEELYFNDPATAAATPSGPDWSALPAPTGTRRATSSALGLLDFDGGR